MSSSPVDPFRQAFADAAAAHQSRQQEPPAPPQESIVQRIFREAQESVQAQTPSHRRQLTLQQQLSSPVVAVHNEDPEITDIDADLGRLVLERQDQTPAHRRQPTLLDQMSSPVVEEAEDLVFEDIDEVLARMSLDDEKEPAGSQAVGTLVFPESPVRSVRADTFSDRMDRVLDSRLLPSHSRQLSRGMPRANPLASELFHVDRPKNTRLSLSPRSANLNQALFGIKDIHSYSMYGPQGPGRQAYKCPKVTFKPELSKKKNSQIGVIYNLEEEQDNYYLNLLAVTPESAQIDFMAASAGKGVVLRNNVTNAISILKHEGLTYRDRELSPTSIAFSPSGRSLLVGTKDNLLEMWTISENGSAKIRYSIKLPAEIVQSVAFAGDRILAGTKCGKLIEIDANNGAIIRCRQLGNCNVYQIAVSPSGNRVAVVAQREVGDDTVTDLFILAPKVEKNPDESHFSCKKTFYTGQARGIKIAFSPDGKYLAAGTGTQDGKLILMEIGRHGSCKELPVKLDDEARQALNVDRNGRLVFQLGFIDEDDEPVGFQASTLQWVKDRDNDVIIATLYNGNVVFLPIDREKQRVGKPLNTVLHNNARPTYCAYRKRQLFSAAPQEVCSYNPSQRGMIRINNL